MPGSFAGGGQSTPCERAQASVLGVVLIIGLTVIGVTGLLIVGSGALNDSQTQSEIDAAEHAMTQLDSRFSIVALGTAKQQSSSVALPSGASLTIHEDRGWMNVSVINRTNNNLRFSVFNESLGALVYENDGTTITYQGGGVWKRGPTGGSVMVSPPEFHYRSEGSEDPTLTLPLVVLRGSGSLTGDATVTRDTTIDEYPIPGNPDRSNPLADGKINVTIKSDYYEAWGAFFQSRTGGTVTYHHDRNEVVLTMIAETNDPQVNGGIVSSSAGYVLEFGQQATIDSYNSSVGDYSTSSGQNTSVIAAGDVELGQGAEIQGDLVTGDTLLFAGGSGQRVHGNLTYGGNPPAEPSKIDGEINSGADVEAPSEVGWLITSRGSDLSDPSDNDNDADADIQSNAIDCSAGDCELPAGSYYLDSFDLQSGDELTLDTSGGDIEIYVDSDAVIDKSDESINVTGDNQVRFFVNQDFTLEEGTIETPNDRASAMWVYMRPSSVADFNDAHFEGVIYGPGSGAQMGVKIKVQANNEIFGGLVGHIPSSGADGIGQNDLIHFDEALSMEDPLGPYIGNNPAVTYMHISVNRVNVSSR